MTAATIPLVAEWSRTARLLNIEVVAPFSITLSSGKRVTADLLVRGFGGPKGTLVARDAEAVWHVRDDLLADGYGFSVMDASARDPYVLEDFVEILREWGWSGAPEDAPPWIGDD